MAWWLQFSELLRNFGLVVAGVLGLYLAWLRVTAANRQAEAQVRQAEATARQAELGQQKLIADLFAAAVAQLGDEKLEMRLLAVYTLRRICDERPDYAPVVLELLTNYVHAKRDGWGDVEPPIDIQEILAFLGATLEKIK